MTKQQETDIDFESSYQELESIVNRMERGEQSLEQSITDFERGVELMKLCHQKLKATEQKVDILIKNNEGLFTTKPFDKQ